MRPNSIVMDVNKPEWLNDLQVMSLKPNDIVVLKFKDFLPQEIHMRIDEYWKRIQSYTGITNKMLILDQGVEIGILSPEK